MTKNKDLKRLTRARMDKTGESYTTARRHLLAKVEEEPAAPSPADYPALAGMSDEAVEARTGCTWKKWVDALDYAGAREMTHREIAAYVHETWDVPGWWAQTVTVGYERIRGLREIGQRRDGTYDANRSRTFPVPVANLYAAWADEDRRATWLGDVDLTVRTATPGKSLRLTWNDDTDRDGTRVDAWFTAKSPAKSQVAVQHGKLPSSELRDRMKVYWGERLDALGDVLTPS